MDLVGSAGAALCNGLRDAMAEMILKQPEGDRFQGPRYGGYLGEDVDAVLLFLDHPLQAAHLSFDAAKSPSVRGLVVRVAVQLALRVALYLISTQAGFIEYLWQAFSLSNFSTAQ